MPVGVTIAIVLSALALVAAAVCATLTVNLHGKASRMAEPHRRFLEALGEVEFPADLTEFLSMLGTVHRRVQANEARVDGLANDLRGAITRVGLVRFDAFENMGGQMSFSFALTDDHANGLILTGIHSRSSFDSYCRRVVAGQPEVEISKEEHQALKEALSGWAPH